MSRKGIAYKLLALLLLASCQRESSVMEQDYLLSFSVETGGSAVKSGLPISAARLLKLESQEGDLCFLMQEEEFSGNSLSTKASVYTGTSLPESVSIGFTAYKYENSGAAASAWTLHTSPSVMEAVYDGSRNGRSKKWVPTTRLLWPGSGYVKYFAYAPFEAAGATVTAASGAAPSIAYTVPATYDEQVDLLVADAASSCEYEGDPLVTAIDVPLTFNHALTAIRFRVGKGLSISSVSIKDVYNKGTLSLGAATRNWTLDNASKATYTLTSPTLKTDPTDSDYSIVNDEYTLILMPQTLPAGTLIEATVNNDTFSKTISAVMEGEVWAPGKLITYTITTEENVGVPVFKVSYGGTTVSSSGTQVDGGKIEISKNNAVNVGFSVTTNLGFTVTSSAPDLIGNNLPSGAASMPETVTPVSINVPFVLAHGQLPEQSSFVKALFHVGSNKEVAFSPGNLQYQASTNTWRFAQHQWDYVGNDNFGTVFTGTEKSNNESISSTYPGWIDLFGWGTSGYDYGPVCYQPYSTSQNRLDYGLSTVTHLTVAAQSDWGVNISPYRTLSKDEWVYLLDSRGSTNTPRYFLASIQTEPMVFTLTFTAVDNPSYSVVYTVERPSWPINGLMVIPDNFENTSLLSSYTLNTLILPKYQEISFSDYFALESAGCVFLPAAGQRDGTRMDWLYNMSRIIGQYWSSTAASSHFAYHLTFEPVTQAWTMYPDHSRMYGMAVRPVVDEDPVSRKGFSVSTSKRVYFAPGNLQATTTDYGASWTWSFAEHQYDIIGSGSANILINGNGSVSGNGTVDLFCWSTPATYYGIHYLGGSNYYPGEFREWGDNEITNGGGYSWRTPSESEIKYLFKTRSASTVGGVADARYCKAIVSGRYGMIIFPDDYTHPSSLPVPSGINHDEADFSVNNYSTTDWVALEEAGAVFLPVGGARGGNVVDFLDYVQVGLASYVPCGFYWTSSPCDETLAYFLYFNPYEVYPADFNIDRDGGFSVRLVRDL